MIRIVRSRHFRRCALMISVLLIANPFLSIAQSRDPDYQGYFSSRLKSKLDKLNSKVQNNLRNYRKDRSVSRLDESYSMVIQSRDEIDGSLKAAIQRLQDTPESSELEKLRAQVDKLEIIGIRDSELPYLCDQLYEIGQLYIKVDKAKAKECFKAIVDKFNSYDYESCGRKAENALENLN